MVLLMDLVPMLVHQITRLYRNRTLTSLEGEGIYAEVGVLGTEVCSSRTIRSEVLVVSRSTNSSTVVI